MGPATWPDIHVTNGKDVIELSLLATDKGAAVDALRAQASASAVLYLGDDVTDENAFAQLHGPDVGIKIGAGRDAGGAPGRRADRRGARARLPARDAPALALRRARGADRAPLHARQRLDRGAAGARREGDLALPPPSGLGGDLRRHPRRRPAGYFSVAPRRDRASRSASATGRAR